MASTAAVRSGLFARSAFRPGVFRRQILQRRPQSTATAAADAAAPEASQSGFAKLWNSEVGPKTVHFWAPIMKWGLVLTGISDFARPAESLSLSQNCALMATGAIWTRWCFIIKPRNLFLASVNALLFCVGATQVTRIFRYKQSLTNEPLADQAKKVADDVKAKAKGVVEDPASAVKSS